MPIYFSLFENHLTTDPNDYTAMVQVSTIADLDAVAERMVQQGTTVTKPDILAVLEDAVMAAEAMLTEGYRINMGGLCELFPRITGIFNGATDTFDRSRHTVDVAAVAGSRVRKTVRSNASVEKLATVLPTPVPLEFVDLGSGETNNIITPGHIGTINGSLLKYDESQADEGVFFIQSNGTLTKVTAIQKNKPGQLVFLNPTGLPLDTFHIEVRARVRGGEQLRVGRLIRELVVP